MNSRTDLKTGRQKRILDSLGSFVDGLFITASRLADHLRPRRTITREAYEQQIDYYIDKCSGLITPTIRDLTWFFSSRRFIGSVSHALSRRGEYICSLTMWS